MLLLFACTDASHGPTPKESSSVLIESDGFILGNVQSCEAPQAPHWTDQAAAWGLTGPTIPEPNHYDGGGIALTDFDQDGSYEVSIFFSMEPGRIYRWSQDHYEKDILPGMGSMGPLYLPDRQELWIGGPMSSRLYWDNKIIDGELPAFPPSYEENVSSVKQWVPTFHDGTMNLFAVVNASSAVPSPTSLSDFLLSNDGDAFSVHGLLDINAAGRRGFDGVRLPPTDILPQERLYVANDMGSQFGGNVLWESQNGSISDQSSSCSCGIEQSFMAVNTADLNEDGIFDILLSGTGANFLLSGQSDGSFIDVTAATGFNTITPPFGMSWAMAPVDLDNDATQEVLVMNGDFWGLDQSTPVIQPAPVDLLVNHAGLYVEEGAAWGLPREGSYRSVLPWDINNDGILDLLITDIADIPIWLVSDGCTENNWITIDGPEGSVVEIEAGGHTRVARLSADLNYGTTAPPRAHFGLGSTETVDRLRITLPDGRRFENTDIAARRVVTLIPD